MVPVPRTPAHNVDTVLGRCVVGSLPPMTQLWRILWRMKTGTKLREEARAIGTDKHCYLGLIIHSAREHRQLNHRSFRGRERNRSRRHRLWCLSGLRTPLEFCVGRHITRGKSYRSPPIWPIKCAAVFAGGNAAHLSGSRYRPRSWRWKKRIGIGWAPMSNSILMKN